MKLKDKLSKSIHYIKKNGIFSFVSLLVRLLFFWFYRKKFKRCSGLHLGHGFFVSGTKNISLGSNFRAGKSLRLEAIEEYGGQTFSPLVDIGENVTFNDYVHIGCVDNIKIGNNVKIGGQAGISGHLRIGNNVEIAGGSGVIRNVPDNSKVMGYPAKNIREFLRENKWYTKPQ